MFTRNRILLSALALVAFAGVAIAQGVGGVGLWNNWPIVGQSSYCATTTNSVCTSTVPAGPSALTGAETIPANRGTSATAPTNVLIPVGSLGGNPITVQSITTGAVGATAISASNLDGGVIYSAAVTITSAAITLPLNPIQGQTYKVSSNRNITTLSVSAASGDSMAANSAPTVLSTNIVGGPQGYVFYYNKSNTTWYRLQ